MPTSQGTLKPFVNIIRSSELYNTVDYPVGGNVTSTTSAVFVATWSAVGVNVINAVYMRSGQILPGMSVSGIGIPAGAVIVGPLNLNGTGTGGAGTYTISKLTTAISRVNSVLPSEPAGTVVTGQAVNQSVPQGPGGVVGPVPGFNCVNIQDLRDYYNLPYPPATPLASPPVIAIVSFGGGIYGQPVTTGQYAGFWKCTDISGNNGAPIQILVTPINGAINAPNADDGGATLENTVDVATVNAFYGMIDPRRDAPIYTPPVIILYIAPSSDISEIYRTFYTVLKNPVVCNGKSYMPSIVTCSWGAPEVAWTQKMAFPPNPSIPVDTDPNPSGIAELNEINDLFAEATKNGINICCAAGDIPLTTVNSSINTFNYAQALLLQGAGGQGNSGQTAAPQPSVFPLTDEMRASLPAPKVMFPASSPYVTCVGGSAVYFPNINVGSYSNPAEFAWARSNGGISSVFSIPAYQQQLPGAASASAAQFLASSLKTANLSDAALGTPNPVYDTISGGYTAPNTAVTLATQTKDDAYMATLNAFNAANAALQAAKLSATDDALMNSLVHTVKDASTALATATESKRLAHVSKDASEDLVVKTQTVSDLLVKAGSVFGAAAASTGAASDTQRAVLDAQFSAQQAAYNQLVTPTSTNATLLQKANQALQAAQAAAASSALAAVTLPAAVSDTTDVANKAVAQAAAAVVAPSLSAHPYLQAQPITSPLVIVSNKAYDAAYVVSGDLPYDSSANTAPSYLLTSVGLGYNTINADADGNPSGDIRTHLNDSVTAANDLVEQLQNQAQWHMTEESGSAYSGHPSEIGEVASLTNAAIVAATGQLQSSGPYYAAATTGSNSWRGRADRDEMLPAAGTSYTASEFAARARDVAKSGAVQISSYQSGAGNANTDGYKLACGPASAAASCLAAVYTVTEEEKKADEEAEFPYGSVDTSGGSDASGNYNGITPGLINLRNIYANTTLAARRATTAHKAAKDAKDAFLAWAEIKERADALQSQATTLYNQVPAPTNDEVRVMDEKLLAAKVALTAASYKLGVADEKAVFTARLAQQSCASASVFMGNLLKTDASGNASFDQLGNLNAVPNDDVDEFQGQNNANCPAIDQFDASGNDVLRAAQAMIQAATNDNYLTTSIDTWNYHGVTGVDTSGNQTVNLTGTKLLVQDAQFAAAGAAGQVANVAFADATESISRFTDWHNVSLVANAANTASALVYAALTDASGDSMPVDASGNSSLIQAVNAITSALALIVGATTPYNQQATTSATIATNNVVALKARLENAQNVCQAAQTAIQLAASTYNGTGSSNISGQAGQGGSIFTVNMAYAKVTADAAQAACNAAAIHAREQAVLAARRANYSAAALRKLVGEGVVGRAVAGFLDASGNLVSQTGYDSAHSLPYTLSPAPSTARALGVNNIKPPAVTQPTVLYQGCGGLSYASDSLGELQSGEVSNPGGNPQPNVITNLTYTEPQFTNVYSAVKGLAEAAQAVIQALAADSSGNNDLDLGDENLDNILNRYPNVNAVNALNTTLGETEGAGLEAVQACLLAAYEAQQWVVASANASFVTFGYTPANVNLVTFTPSLLGVANKLASDADDCLQTVLNAEGAILYALSKRPNRVLLHDLDASNFAAAFNANQSAADTYIDMMNLAVEHQLNTATAFHLADLANALSPLVACASTAANQASALAAMAWSSPVPNSNFASNAALAAANFPAGGWGSASMPSVSANLAAQNANSTNPNYGPYNGTTLGAPPFPAPNASSSSRIQAPAHQVLQASSQLLQRMLSNTTLAVAKTASDAADTATAFNNLMVTVSTVTPSLVDAATKAAQDTLAAAQAAKYATFFGNQGEVSTDMTNVVFRLLDKNYTAILAAANAARANVQAITIGDARYASRKNMLNLWNAAVDAAAEAVQAAANAPTNFKYETTTTPNGTIELLDPTSVVPASLGNIAIMGTTSGVYNTRGNTAPYAQLGDNIVIYGPTIDADPESDAQPSLLSKLNVAVRDAYNATTGAPNPQGDYRYISIEWPPNSGTWVTNFPENVNDTNQAYNKAVAALDATSNVANSTASAALNAAIAIKAAYDAAVAAAAAAEPVDLIRDASGNNVLEESYEDNDMVAIRSIAVGFWNNAVQFSSVLVSGEAPLTVDNLSRLMSIVGINFNEVKPADQTAQAISAAQLANQKQAEIMAAWAQGDQYSGTYTNAWPGYLDASGNQVVLNSFLSNGTAQAQYEYTDASGISTASWTSDEWSAYYWTKALMPTGTVAYVTARNAWNSVLTAYNAAVASDLDENDIFDNNAGSANTSKAMAVYSVKIALQSAARAAAAAQAAGAAAAALATATDSYQDRAAEAAMDAAYASTANLNMYRCVPDIAMHANADDLPVIFRMNGGNVYVGGTAVAASMFAGFLGVVQSQSPINYFVNPMLYDNYTFPSPLFNDISGSKQVWYPGSLNGVTVPPRIANILPGVENPVSGLGSGLYNCNVGLGSISGMNLSALMQVPRLVDKVSPADEDNMLVQVYPGTSETLTVYVEPVTAYSPYVSWSCSSPNAVVSQTNGPVISANGTNDMDPYTTYNPLKHDSSGNQLPPTSTNGDYTMGNLGDVVIGTNPFNNDAPCYIFTATVTGVVSVPASAPLPVVTVSSTDGSSVYGKYSISVLPAIQVSGVSISAENERENPANTTLFLGTTLQLNANVTPLSATNKRVYWWSSNTAVVNVDASGLLTSLAPGSVTIKATSVNNNISASISVYVPTPITGISVLPTTITLNPNMGAFPLKNLGLIRAVVQPAEADYKHLSWEIVSSQQAQPAPTGITDVVSLPRDGTVLARDSGGDITDNTEATLTALSNGTAVIKVSTYGEPYGVYGTYTSMVTVNVVTPVTDVVMTETDMVINLNPHTAQYDSNRSLPEVYKVTATLKPAYPSNMNVFWSSSNPKVAVVSNNTPAVLNTTVSDPNFGLWQISETITPLSNGTTVIKVTTADGSKTASTTVVVTTPVTGLSMSAMPVLLNPTKLYTLQATVLPTTATNRSLVWESTNTAIATVDATGVVKAITSGSCGIRATTVDGDFSALSEISVVTPLVGVQLMVNTPLPIHINDVVQILVVMVPTTASNQQFTWTVTDGVDGNIFTTGPPQNGNIVYLDAVQAGNSVFTVTTADGNKQASINLQVVQW